MIKVILNPDKLSKYTWGDDFPVTSCIRLYEACGLYEEMKKFYNGYDINVAPIEVLTCNFYTLQWIKKFIEDNWKHYNISIDGDEHLFWKSKNRIYHKYENTLSGIVKNSVQDDFRQYCPALDDELEDLVIVFTEQTDEEK